MGGPEIFGWNLFITCRKFGMNHNDAFSAMKLDSHRHFLRICIDGDTVTVFPIKLAKVPGRKGWRYNPKDEGSVSFGVQPRRRDDAGAHREIRVDVMSRPRLLR